MWTDTLGTLEYEISNNADRLRSGNKEEETECFSHSLIKASKRKRYLIERLVKLGKHFESIFKRQFAILVHSISPIFMRALSVM